MLSIVLFPGFGLRNRRKHAHEVAGAGGFGVLAFGGVGQPVIGMAALQSLGPLLGVRIKPVDVAIRDLHQ
jgi:hypothetical protein